MTEQVAVPVRNVLLRSLVWPEPPVFVVPREVPQNSSCLQQKMPPNLKLQHTRNLTQKMQVAARALHHVASLNQAV